MSFVSSYYNFKENISTGAQDDTQAAIRAELINHHLLSQTDAPILMSYYGQDPCVTTFEKDKPPKTYVWQRGASDLPKAIGTFISKALGQPVDVPSMLHRSVKKAKAKQVKLVPPASSSNSRAARPAPPDLTAQLRQAEQLLGGSDGMQRQNVQTSAAPQRRTSRYEQSDGVSESAESDSDSESPASEPLHPKSRQTHRRYLRSKASASASSPSDADDERRTLERRRQRRHDDDRIVEGVREERLELQKDFKKNVQKLEQMLAALPRSPGSPGRRPSSRRLSQSSVASEPIHL